MTSNKKSCLVIILILGKYRSSSNIIVMFSKTLQKAAGIEKLNLKQTTLVHTVTGSGSPYCMYVHSVYMALFGSLYFQVN